MYFAIFVLIFLCVFIELKLSRINSINFYFIYIVLTLMITLRYGQGTDYYGYKVIYTEVSSFKSFIPLLLMHDPGYLLLNYCAINFNISYKLFSSLFSLITMFVFYPFFSAICKKSMIPMFFFYTSFFLVYPFSGARQGFTIAVVLGILFPLLLRKRFVLFFLITLLASSVHQSLLACLLIPFVYNINISVKKMLILFFLLTLIMFCDLNIFNYLPIGSLSERVSVYFDTETNAKYVAKIIRILVILPVFLISEKHYNENKELKGIRNILFTGYAIYSMFSFSELTSSRLAIYYRVFEGFFVFSLLYRTNLRMINKQLAVCYICFSSLFFAKDINSFIDQGKYENCNIFTYPYLSIFDNEQTLFYYRKYYGENDVEI